MKLRIFTRVKKSNRRRFFKRIDQMKKIQANPDVLRWARESANLSCEDVAQKIKKPAEMIQSWESGRAFPTYVQLEKLAYQIYKRPIAVFFFPEPPKEESPFKSFRTLPEHERQKLSPNILHLLRKAQAMQINLEELCEGRNPAQRKIWEEVSIAPGQSLKRVATRVRSALGVSLEEQVSWKNVDSALKQWRAGLEGKGVFVFKEAFRQPEISGFCLFHREFPVIYLNNSMPKTRQIFTLFHELAHLLLGTSGIDKVEDDDFDLLSGADSQIERFCNRFAAAFLVPDSDFDRRIDGCEFDDGSIYEFAKRYSVSREVVLRKLRDRHLIDSETYRVYVSKWADESSARKSRSGGGDYYLTRASYLGRQYLDLAFGKYYQNQIGIGQLADYLNVRVSNIAGIEEAMSR